jgi:hypothetical protein
MQHGSTKQEPENRNWQVVVDLAVLAKLVAGVMIGVFVSLFWK